MGRYKRHFLGHWQDVSNTCAEHRFLLSPTDDDEEFRQHLLGLLGYLIDGHKVELHSFCFTTHGYRLVVRGPEGNRCKLSYFMRDLNKGISDITGRLRDWSGPLWKARFEAVPILDASALQQVIAEVLCQGLVEFGEQRRSCGVEPASGGEQTQREDQGAIARQNEANIDQRTCLSSWPEHLGRPRTVRRQDREAWYHTSGHKRGAPIPCSLHRLRLTPLPAALLECVGPDRHLAQMAWFVRLEATILARGSETSASPSRVAAGCTGHRTHPACHASRRADEEVFIEEHRRFEREYHAASLKLRMGDSRAEFPGSCFRPVLAADWEAKVVALDRPCTFRVRLDEDGQGVVEFA